MSTENQHIMDTLNRLCSKVDGLAEKQSATSEGLAVVATKVEDVRREMADRDELQKCQAAEIKNLTECVTEFKTGVGVAKFLGTSGILSGIGTVIWTLLSGPKH